MVINGGPLAFGLTLVNSWWGRRQWCISRIFLKRCIFLDWQTTLEIKWAQFPSSSFDITNIWNYYDKVTVFTHFMCAHTCASRFVRVSEGWCVFWNQVSHRAWSSLSQLGWLATQFRALPVSSAPVLDCRCVPPCLAFHMDAGDPTQAFVPLSWAHDLLSHLPSPQTFMFLEFSCFGHRDMGPLMLSFCLVHIFCKGHFPHRPSGTV